MLKDAKLLSLVFLQRGGTGVIVGDFSKSPYRFSFTWRLLQKGYRRRCASFCNFLSIVLIVDLWFRCLFVIPLGCGSGFYRATLRTPKVLRHLPHHLALEVGVVVRALPWGHDRGVDGLLHIHFQQLVVVDEDDLVAEVLVAVLVAKDVSDLPSREAARHRGQLAGAEGVAALSDVGLQKGEVDGVIAHPPPGGAGILPRRQSRRVVWPCGALWIRLPCPVVVFLLIGVSLCFPQNYYFFPNPLLFSEEMFWKAKDNPYLCIVSPRQASSQCSNRARRFLFMPPCARTVLRPLPNGRDSSECRLPREIAFLENQKKACQLRKKVSTSERSCSSVKWSVASYVLCVALSFPS